MENLTNFAEGVRLLDLDVVLDNPYKPMYLIPFGCVHADDPGFKEPLFKRCLTDLLKPQSWGIGCGDYRNFLRTTARKHLKSYTADDDSFRELDSLVRGRVQQDYRAYYQGVQDRILLMGEGNHFHEFREGMSDTQYLCELMGVPYGGKPCMLRLTVKYDAGKKRGLYTLRTFKILIHHGDWSGGNSRIGGDVNAAEMKALGFDFDIYIFSHTHRLWGMHIPSLTIPSRGEMKVVERPRAFIRTGCFMTGYETCGQRSYAQKRLLHPTALGYVKLEITFKRPYNPVKYRRDVKGSGFNAWQYAFRVSY